jgi:hypothetical protein
MRWSALLVGLVGCMAPDALSDDEDVLPLAEASPAPGGDVARADGWSAQTADGGGNGGTTAAALSATLEADGTVRCVHTALPAPCGELGLGEVAWDDAAREARVTYVAVPDDSAATCLWSTSYTLRGLGSDTGTLIASAILEDGTPVPDTEGRAEWAP